MFLLMSTHDHTCPPLRTICLKYLSDNVDILYCQESRILLPSEIWEAFIKIHQRFGRTIDDNLLSILNTNIQRLQLQNASITDAGLNAFLEKSRHLVELELRSCNNITSGSIDRIGLSACCSNDAKNNDDIAMESQDEWSGDQPTLRKLALNGFDFTFESNVRTQDYIFTVLTQLTTLDLSKCDIDRGAFNPSRLPNLESLCLYDVSAVPHFISDICKTVTLRHLDISASGPFGTYRKASSVLTQIVLSLPNLVSLDISGTNLPGKGRPEEYIGHSGIIGLSSRVNNPLHYLGLFNTPNSACSRSNIPARVISGNADESQLLIAAHVFKSREEMLVKVLKSMYSHVRYETVAHVEEFLSVLVQVMDENISDYEIQVSASSVLYHLIVNYKDRLTAMSKQRIIWTLLNSMDRFRNQYGMVRNVCFILSRFQIPEELYHFERSLNLMLSIIESPSLVIIQIPSLCLQYLTTLAGQVDLEDKRVMGDLGIVKVMLKIIKDQLTQQISDEILDNAWSALWNVTDETPINCERFLKYDGLKLFMQCFKAFPEKETVRRNMLGLLGNISEVKSLRPFMMTNWFINVLMNLLHSENEGIEVSYNAAGIISHLASDGEAAWEVTHPPRKFVLKSMVSAIETWDLGSERTINYRSLLPIFDVLKATHTPECQLWGLWAIANYTKVFPDKYFKLLESEGGIPLVKMIDESASGFPKLKELSSTILTQHWNYENVHLEG